MKCAKCGNALQAGERFCGECGTPVTVVTPSPIAVPPATATYPVRQGVTPPPVMPPPPPPPAASRRGLVLALSGVGVAGGLGFLTYVRTTPVPFWVPSTPTPVPTPGPKRLIVDASGSGDYKTIASAILGARPEDTIVLRPGTYKEAVEIDRDVRIVGEGGRSKAIVEAASGEQVFDFLSGSATLTGMTIRYTGPKDPGGGIGAISVTGGKPVIEDCDLTSSAGAAVYISGAGANPVIRNCTMRNSQGPGVNVFDQGQGTIEQCVISGNGASGVQIGTGGNPTVRDCEIRDGKSAGVLVFDQGQGTFTGNTLTGNAIGAWVIKPDAGRVTRTGNRPNG